MDYLSLGQNLHREARYAGVAPVTMQGLSGQALDVAEWIKDAWLDIQRMHDGHWRWLWGEFTLSTVASTGSYAYGSCTDVDSGSAITRFHEWMLNDRYDAPKVYLTSQGVATERWLIWTEWEAFKQVYRIGTQNDAPPVHIAVDPAGRIVLGPTPNDIYTVTGNYWKSPQELSADDDVPECPEHFHKSIVYEALAKYGYANVAQEAVMRANVEGTRLLSALMLNQSMARRRFRKAPPLA